MKAAKYTLGTTGGTWELEAAEYIYEEDNWGDLDLKAVGYTQEDDRRDTAAEGCRVYMERRLERYWRRRRSVIHGRTTAGILELQAVGYTWEDYWRNTGAEGLREYMEGRLGGYWS